MTARACDRAWPSVLCTPGVSSKNFSSLDFKPGCGSGGRRGGSAFSGRIDPHRTRTLRHVKVLLHDSQVNRRISVGEIVFQACCSVHSGRKELSRVSGELSRARWELGRTESDLHAIRGRAAAVEARDQSMEAARSFSKLSALPLRYVSDYGRSSMSADLLYTSDKRSFGISYEESQVPGSYQTPAPAHSFSEPPYPSSVQTSFFMTTGFEDYMLRSLLSPRHRSCHGGTYSRTGDCEQRGCVHCRVRHGDVSSCLSFVSILFAGAS